MKNLKPGWGIGALGLLILVLVCPLESANAQTSLPALDDDALFGGSSDIVTVIDTNVAATSVVELVKDSKTYPVFLVEGDLGAGLTSSLVPYGASGSDKNLLFGAVRLDSLAFTYAPVKDVDFNITTSATLLPNSAADVSVSAYANLRASEYTRFYASGKYNYKVSSSSTASTADGLALDEIFIDTAINRKYFFRLGKQRVSWGVGYWFKPADVLSLAQIDPDNPTASREGPFAFKADMPFGLNHATLYAVPPPDGSLGKFSIAERTDIVSGIFELSFAGFARTDMGARPRLMFMFTGSIGLVDVYGENVALWGSDRNYVREKDGGGYELYRVENQLLFQSTLGLKYSWQNSDGLSASFHVQGYYNGTGYEDSSILQTTAARNLVKASSAYTSNDLAQAGMYYLGASVSFGARFGEGKKLTNTSLGSTALFNFSDGSMRFKPSWSLTVGSGGSALNLAVSALTSLGKPDSEYAPKGNMVTPALTATINKTVQISASAPLKLDTDYSLKKASLALSLYWNVLSY